MPDPRLLFISQTLPYPPDSGVNIRTFHTLRALAGEFSTRVLAFWRRGAFDDPAEVPARTKELEEAVGAPVSTFPIPMEWSRPAEIGVHLRSLLLSRPFTHFAHSAPEFSSDLLRGMDQAPPDLIHLDSLDLSAALDVVRASTKTPRLICTHHNVESELLRRRGEAERSWLRRAYLVRQADLYAAEERRACPSFDLNIAVSKRDAAKLEETTEARFETIPNGVDLEFFRPASGPDRRGVVFVGGSNWFPNRDALEFFAREILPLVRTAMPDLPVTWVGRCEDGDQERFWRDHRVRLTGYVPDIRPYLADANCMVVPLRVGGGTRLKVTTAWAAGLPVVGTSLGLEGLEGRPGKHFLMEDEPAAFAEGVVKLHRDPDLWRTLAESGRRLAEDSYGWEAIGRRLCGLYRALL